MPTARTAIPATAASVFTGAGAKAAAAASGAGATASSDDQAAGMGSAPTSAEMVVSCAALARSSAARRHGQLGGAGDATVGEPGSASTAQSGGALLIVIGNPMSTSPKITNIADQASRR